MISYLQIYYYKYLEAAPAGHRITRATKSSGVPNFPAKFSVFHNGIDKTSYPASVRLSLLQITPVTTLSYRQDASLFCPEIVMNCLYISNFQLRPAQ